MLLSNNSDIHPLAQASAWTRKSPSLTNQDSSEKKGCPLRPCVRVERDNAGVFPTKETARLTTTLLCSKDSNTVLGIFKTLFFCNDITIT